MTTTSTTTPAPLQCPPRSLSTEMGQVSSSVRKIEARISSTSTSKEAYTTTTTTSSMKNSDVKKSYVSQFSSKLGFGSSSSSVSVSTPPRPTKQQAPSGSDPNPTPNSSLTSKTSSLLKSAFSFYKSSAAPTPASQLPPSEPGSSGQGDSPYLVSIQISSPEFNSNGNRSVDADPAASPLAKMSEKLVHYDLT